MNESVLNPTYNWEWHSVVEYNCHYSNDCEEYGCDSICRCGIIEDTQITSVSIWEMAKNILPKGNQLDIYCVDRLLTKEGVYSPCCWEITIRGGYYGEEVDKVLFLDGTQIFNLVNQLLEQKTVTEKIKFILKHEYGYLLESLKNLEFSIERIHRNDIKIPNEFYAKKISSYDLKPYKDYREKFSYPGPVCVVREDENKNRILVDGYHRYLASEGLEEIQVVVGKLKEEICQL